MKDFWMKEQGLPRLLHLKIAIILTGIFTYSACLPYFTQKSLISRAKPNVKPMLILT
jgi:hypothetical protein